MQQTKLDTCRESCIGSQADQWGLYVCVFIIRDWCKDLGSATVEYAQRWRPSPLRLLPLRRDLSADWMSPAPLC